MCGVRKGGRGEGPVNPPLSPWEQPSLAGRVPRLRTMDATPMIEVSELTKRYPGRTAVNGISFTVARGRWWIPGAEWRREVDHHANVILLIFPDQRYGAGRGL